MSLVGFGKSMAEEDDVRMKRFTVELWAARDRRVSVAATTFLTTMSGSGLKETSLATWTIASTFLIASA